MYLQDLQRPIHDGRTVHRRGRPDRGDAGDDGTKVHGANRLLAALPERDRARLLPHLEAVRLIRGEILFQPGRTPAHVYLPHAGTMVSLALPLPEGGSAEMAVIGDESIAGLGLDPSDREADPLLRGVVLVPGTCARIATGCLADAAAASPDLRRILARHAEASLSMALHAAACHGRHPLRARLATWLLTALDRAPQDGAAIPLTQGRLAGMLGVHRASVSPALLALQGDGFVQARRGRVLLVDRAALEHAACGCRAAIRRRLGRLDAGAPR